MRTAHSVFIPGFLMYHENSSDTPVCREGNQAMKFIFRILSVFAAAVILTACGSSAAPEPTPLPLAGTYRLAELTDDDGTSLNDKLSKLAAEGSMVTLVLSEDRTGTYRLFDETESVTWTESSLTLYGETLSMEWSNGTLTVFSGGGTEGKMVFVPAEQG